MLLTAHRVLLDGVPRAGIGIVVDGGGRITAVGGLEQVGRPTVDLGRRLVMPGMINAHAQIEQHLLTVDERAAGWGDDASLRLHERLEPASLFETARHAFTASLAAGVTTVGVLHRLLHQPSGEPYNKPTAMAEAVAEAALSTGIRLCLLRAINPQPQRHTAADPLTRRGAEPSLDVAWRNTENALRRLRAMGSPRLYWGIGCAAPAEVSIETVVAIKTCAGHLPLHLPTGTRATDRPRRDEGASPIALLARHGALDATTTLLQVGPLSREERGICARAGAPLCLVPAGAGAVPDILGSIDRLGECIALGSGATPELSVLAQTRRLAMRPAALPSDPPRPSAAAVLDFATVNGARALDVASGKLATGRWADLIAFDLDSPPLTGLADDDLLPALLFADVEPCPDSVWVGGERVIHRGEHPLSAASARGAAAAAATIFADR